MVIYPSLETLEILKDSLIRSNFTAIPPMDDRWCKEMFGMFELVALLPHCQDTFEIAAANLFFKVAKNHRRTDGNKRSAITCLIIFEVLNSKDDTFTVQEIEDLAIEVAASHGNTGEIFIPQLTETFKKKIIDMT